MGWDQLKRHHGRGSGGPQLVYLPSIHPKVVSVQGELLHVPSNICPGGCPGHCRDRQEAGPGLKARRELCSRWETWMPGSSGAGCDGPLEAAGLSQRPWPWASQLPLQTKLPEQAPQDMAAGRS